MIAISIVASVIAALEVLSHSEVVGMLDHKVAESVRQTHSHLTALHRKLHHKHHAKGTDHDVQA